MSLNSKVQICNMALSHLGQYGSVNNIDIPTTTTETTFALWYDTARQNLIKLVMPNFAMQRRYVAQLSAVPTFGYIYGYEYPVDCLKLLGVGNVECKENEYSVEGNVIYTDLQYSIPVNGVLTPTGLPIRFLQDVTDVPTMSADFQILLSWQLAAYVVMPITQSLEKKKLIEEILPEKMTQLSGMNAQENRPIRINNSRYKQARFTPWPSFQTKK